MSLLLREVEKSISLAVVRGGSKKDKRNNEIVYVSKDHDASNMKDIKLDAPMYFQLIPPVNMERATMYYAGRSGSGKSTQVALYVEEYHKIYPDNDIYLFSLKKVDPAFDNFNFPIHRIPIDESLNENQIQIDELASSCVIFDDVDQISHNDKLLRNAVYNLIDQCLELGRASEITCIVTYHLLTNGKDTRKILNEVFYITIFPESGSFRGINYLLKEYLGFTKKQINKIKSLKSNWVTIYNTAPMTIISEHECFLLKAIDDAE